MEERGSLVPIWEGKTDEEIYAAINLLRERRLEAKDERIRKSLAIQAARETTKNKSKISDEARNIFADFLKEKK